MLKITNKEEAEALFGCKIPQIAKRYIGVTRCSLYQWSEPYNQRRQNELLGAAVRAGILSLNPRRRKRGAKAKGMPHAKDGKGKNGAGDASHAGKNETVSDKDRSESATVNK